MIAAGQCYPCENGEASSRVKLFSKPRFQTRSSNSNGDLIHSLTVRPFGSDNGRSICRGCSDSTVSGPTGRIRTRYVARPTCATIAPYFDQGLLSAAKSAPSKTPSAIVCSAASVIVYIKKKDAR